MSALEKQVDASRAACRAADEAHQKADELVATLESDIEQNGDAEGEAERKVSEAEHYLGSGATGAEERWNQAKRDLEITQARGRGLRARLAEAKEEAARAAAASDAAHSKKNPLTLSADMAAMDRLLEERQALLDQVELKSQEADAFFFAKLHRLRPRLPTAPVDIFDAPSAYLQGWENRKRPLPVRLFADGDVPAEVLRERARGLNDLERLQLAFVINRFGWQSFPHKLGTTWNGQPGAWMTLAGAPRSIWPHGSASIPIAQYVPPDVEIAVRQGLPAAMAMAEGAPFDEAEWRTAYIEGFRLESNEQKAAYWRAPRSTEEATP